MENQKSITYARKLRKNMTQEERKLWYLFLKSYPVQFRRQSPQEGYILDFYCRPLKLAIELDGSQHYESEGLKQDARRTAQLATAGISVLRFTNTEINRNFRAVCEAVDLAVRNRMK